GLRPVQLPLWTQPHAELGRCHLHRTRAAAAVDAPHLRSRSFDKRRRISRYSQTSVTRRPKPAYHSMYLGAPCRTPFSMKSKSSTRLSAATTTTNAEKAIPNVPDWWMNGIETPKKPSTKLAR